MRIFLVRHGLSRANVDWRENRDVADHAIELTEEGHEQARKVGEFLAGYFAEYLCEVHDDGFGQEGFIPDIRLWHSPYMRTRQTAADIESTCLLDPTVRRYRTQKNANHDVIMWRVREPGESWFLDKREHLLLAEQQFGIFDGLTDKERAEQYPDMWGYYSKCKRYGGKLWPKMPLGESRFEVCQRIHQAFGTFHRDANKRGIVNIVIVGHGTTNRAFVQMWLHKPYEWMHDEPNPKNGSVRLIEGNEDRGYIFEGFDTPEGYKIRRNRETEE